MYILEGNIGAGKSTFLKLIGQQIPEIKTSLEPVTDWEQAVYGKSLLANFYQEPKRWAYTFETLTMICRVQDYLKEQTDGQPKIIERSVYSGFYCFALNSYTEGYLTDLEWSIYQEWFSMLVPQKCIPPRGFIYLRVSPEVAYERIKKRNRHAEKTMSLAYLKLIHQRHESFLIRKEGILPHLRRIPVLILDCDDEFENNETQLQNHIDQVKLFLGQTGTLITAPYSQSPQTHSISL